MSRINAYVTTAANGWESSWGTYCPPLDTVGGVPLGTCLGDLYSVSWMEDSDKTDLSSESLEQQFRLVKHETRKSHVEQFGSSHVRKEIVGDFLSNYDLPATANGEAHGLEQDEVLTRQEGSAVDAHDISLTLAFYKYLRSPVGPKRSKSAAELIRLIQERQRADALFRSIRQAFQVAYGEELRPAGMKNDSPTSCDAEVFLRFGRLVTTQLGETQASDMPLGFTSYSLQYAGILTDLCARLGTINAVDVVLRRAIISAPSVVEVQ
jgi:hypothetical protein